MLRWPPRLTGSQWADTNRVLPAGDAEPGPFRTDRFPLLREIQDVLCDGATRRIVLWGPAQAAKTTAICTLIGWIIEHDPGRTLIIFPTEDKAAEFAAEKLEPMIAASPSLAARAAVGNARTMRKSLLTKSFPGMVMFIRGGNSENAFSSGAMRYVILDEVDRIPVTAEGRAIDLAAQRVTTFHNHKLVISGTCTDSGVSEVESEYQRTDRRRPFVPCLQCGEMQVLEFEHLDFDGAEDPDEAARRARYRCVRCGHEHRDADKARMLAGVEWRAERDIVGAAGFWWNALYSPWVGFGQLAREFRAAAGDLDAYRVFWNCRLSRVWEVRGDRPDDAMVRGCVDHERARGSVPSGTIALTAGVDVQQTHCYYVVRAWGAQWRSWLVAEGMIPRSEDRSLDFLDEVLFVDYGGYHVAAAFIDSGYSTDTVYSYCLGRRGRVWPAKGWEQRAMPVEFSDIERMPGGQRLPSAIQLAHVSASHWKSFVHDHIRVTAGDPGEWRVHGEVCDDYLEQIVGERRERRVIGTRETWKFMPVKGRMNHYLDAEALAAACAWMPVAVHRRSSPARAVASTRSSTPAPKPERPRRDPWAIRMY